MTLEKGNRLATIGLATALVTACVPNATATLLAVDYPLNGGTATL